MDVDLNSLLSKVETTLAAPGAVPPHEAETAIRELIDALSRHPETESSDAACHALGLLWYHLPGDSPERSEAAEKWLRMALAINPHHEEARILLAHHFYDQDCYGAAREQFLRTPPGYFGRLGQGWRDLKVREMIACCEIYRYPERLSLELVLPVYQDYLIAVNEDAAVPLELVRAVAWATLSTAMTDPIRRAARGCLELIEWLQLGGKFEDEIRVIRQTTGLAGPMTAG